MTSIATGYGSDNESKKGDNINKIFYLITM